MSAVGTRRIIWSNGEDDFCAAKIGTILAIEEKCNAGVGEVYARLINGTWRICDVREVIRLALIGGGMDSKTAQKTVEIHVDMNPEGLVPSIILAQSILEAVLVGVKDDDIVGKETAVEATDPESSMTTDASAAPQSTD